MKFYLAPLEGITGYIYRRAVGEYYGKGMEKYFIPFLEPHTKRDFNAKELQNILPENNRGRYTVPQVLTKSAADYLALEEALLSYGYEEINLNIGCPSGTVVAKGRGAGLLDDVEVLDHFLEEIFANTKARVSVKTRIGMEQPEEFYEILEVYNKYDMEELIVHPRVRQEFYRGKPHMDIYQYALESSENRLVYNGDITSPKSFAEIVSQTGHTDAFMVGRGQMTRPDLVEILSEKHNEKILELPDLEISRFQEFHNRLLFDYKQEMSGDKNVLFKMKELWSFWENNFADSKKEIKKIKKAQRVDEYQIAVKNLLHAYE